MQRFVFYLSNMYVRINQLHYTLIISVVGIKSSEPVYQRFVRKMRESAVVSIQSAFRMFKQRNATLRAAR